MPQVPAVSPAGITQASPEQQVAAVVHGLPDGAQVGGASQRPPEQMPEQHWDPPLHTASLARQLGVLAAVAHTVPPSTSVVQVPSQHSVDPLQGCPFGVQLTAVQWFFPSRASNRQGAPPQHWSLKLQTVSASVPLDGMQQPGSSAS
jgi:hypothetical protein